MAKQTNYSVSLSDLAVDRLEFIQQSYGLASRSAAIAVAVNEVFHMLVSADNTRRIKELSLLPKDKQEHETITIE